MFTYTVYICKSSDHMKSEGSVECTVPLQCSQTFFLFLVMNWIIFPTRQQANSIPSMVTTTMVTEDLDFMVSSINNETLYNGR